MKILNFFLISVALFSLFSVSVYAGGETDANRFFDELVEIIPKDTLNIESPEEVLSGVGIDSFLEILMSAFSERSGEVVSFFVFLLGVTVFIAASESSPFDSPTFSKQISAGISAVCSLAVFSRIEPVVGAVKESIEELSLFFSSLLPVITGISAAGGGVNLASVQAFNMNLTLSVVGRVASAVLIPLSMSLFALALLSGFDNGGISTVSKNVKGFFGWILGIGSTVLLGVVSLQSMIASATDTAYLRAAKYAASGMIPVVGSTVSGALATLVGGLSYVRSAVGTSAVMVVVTMSLSPLVVLLLYRLSFSICISVLEFVGAVGGVRTFSAFRAAFDSLISVYVVSVLVYITEIVIFMKSGVEIFG